MYISKILNNKNNKKKLSKLEENFSLITTNSIKKCLKISKKLSENMKRKLAQKTGKINNNKI